MEPLMQLLNLELKMEEALEKRQKNRGRQIEYVITNSSGNDSEGSDMLEQRSTQDFHFMDWFDFDQC